MRCARVAAFAAAQRSKNQEKALSGDKVGPGKLAPCGPFG